MEYNTILSYFSYLSIFCRILGYTFNEVIFMKPLKEKISITVDSDILEIIRKLAEKDDRSLSQYINIVLKTHITKEENKKDN